jgi:alkylation response protein AidB-like acyl-CoA dehydrogenase
MSADIDIKKVVQGGSFLIEDTLLSVVFTPEEFDDNHKMIAQTTEEFFKRELSPQIEKIEHKDFQVVVNLLRKAGEKGLNSVSISEEHGGLDLDVTCSMLVTEYLCQYGSFAVAHGAHTGIGTLPIHYFGNEAQKKKYLPLSCTAEKVFAYALTEAGSGSDAMAAKSTAVLNEAGTHYICNGEKMWITNAGFADVFITFVQIDGNKFSCLIIEKEMEGVSTGREEEKMGIHGSSTRTLVLNQVKVPKENLLGEIGKGHKIAFNILNIGRFKLGAGCLGGSKISLRDAIQYANQRKQFNTLISQFGAIQEKLAEMATRIYVLESMVYRTSGLLDQKMASLDKNNPQEVLEGIEEYAVECSILKVFGSEVLDHVVDEHVQILGGYGYSKEYTATRFYLDSRINRIFEGTNEINRMLIPGMLMKKAMKGQLALFKAAKALQEELLNPSTSAAEEEEGILAVEKKLVRNAKKIVLMTLGSAAQQFMAKLQDQQEILLVVADIIIETYAMESALLRCLKLVEAQGEDNCQHALEMTRIYLNDAMARIEQFAKKALPSILDGDDLRIVLIALKRLTKYTPINTIALRRNITRRMIDSGKYYTLA